MSPRRPLRLRNKAAIRDMVAETSIDPTNLIYPLFVKDGGSVEERFPGLVRLPLSSLVEIIAPLYSKGLRSVILFGIPDKKDAQGSAAFHPDGVVQRAIGLLKSRFPDLIVMTDVCLCQYTEHGHCGILTKDGSCFDEEATLATLAKIAVSHAEAGADVVAPSAMADNQVAAIRSALDENGHTKTLIMSYSAKYASSLYAPFRELANSAPLHGDRTSYQMDPRNRREALTEVALDIEQGADIVMVKPAMPYLDVISAVRARFDTPLAAFQVSGEYLMLKLYANQTRTEERRVVLEAALSIKRAGATILITYFTPQLLDWLKEV